MRPERPLLDIESLRVDLGPRKRSVHVLRGVDLVLQRGSVGGLVGESGSGKSTMMLAAAGLLPESARLLGGAIRLDGLDLAAAGEAVWRGIRGRRVGVVFQNGRRALHPMRTVAEQLARVHRRHLGSTPEDARRAALATLASVGFPRPLDVADRYPHQLSGGQCQRAMIGVALVAHPELILADEPTSGLDVTVQLQVLETLLERVRESQTTLLLISHDIGVIERTCDTVNVMYAGEVVESGSREAVLEHPAHPYTRALLALLDPQAARMPFVGGTVPDLRATIDGCAFADRCPMAMNGCRVARPVERTAPAGQDVRCVLYDESSPRQPEEAVWRR